ncbi:pescadillo [Tanacetum coccineum]
MDPNSSLEKICLGDDVIIISIDKVEGSGDWNSLEYQDTAVSKGKKFMDALSFYRMETDEISERYIAPCFMNGLEAFDGEVNLAFDENLISNEFAVKLCFDYEVKKGKKLVKKELIVALKGDLYFVKFIINPEEDDFEPGSGEELPPFVSGRHLTQEEASKEELAIRISQIYALLEEERPVIETMAYNDKYKKILDEIWKDKVELDGKTVKEDEEAVKRIKGEELKDKDDDHKISQVLEGKVNKNALADTGSDINTMPYRIFETLGREDMKKIDRGITMIDHTQAEAMGKLSNVLCQVGVTTIIVKFLILDIPIDRDAPIVVGQGFLRTMGSILNTSERIFSTFDGIYHQTFQATRFDVLRIAESDSDDEEEYVIKRNKFGAPIYGPRPTPYLNCTNPEDRSSAIQTTSRTHDEEAGSSRSKRPRQHETVEELYNTRLAQLLPRHIYLPCIINWDVLNQMGFDGEIDNMLRIRVREAESEEEFDEVCADDELQSKKIIKFRLGGRAHSLTLLEFAQRLGLYQAVELEEDGFNVYFEGGLRNDNNFNAQDYWLSISREENLSLTTGYDKVQKNDLWLLSMFDARHQNGYANVACEMDEEERSWDSERELNLMWDLDTTTLRDLIDYDGKLIPEDPQPGVPRVGIPRPPRASMQDLYDRMGRTEIRQDAIERMEYIQSYHWDMYHGVFEHMARVYSVPLQGAYNPPGYPQSQYD